MDHKYIGIFGMMGSGKSVLMNEYLIQKPIAREEKFTKPPVEAKFRGMDFEFVDQIFALNVDGYFFNFYELDAPTINKWTQFIEVADAMIIAYNYTKQDYFESHDKFITNIIKHSTVDVPLFFVVNQCNDLQAAEKKLEEVFHLSDYSNRKIIVHNIPTGNVEYHEKYGKRIVIDFDKLDHLYTSVIQQLLKK